jgi:3',5'-cyclic AMP phosphodiesterase CpdA
MSPPDFPPIAIIADAHVHDPAADLGFPGASGTGGLSVRPLADAARSTRVFNEGVFALRTALDDVVARGIRHVVLLGDYTDDGQIATTAAVAAMLDRMVDEHGLTFYALPGNHDIFGDAGRHRTKRFLNADGSSAVVTSYPDGGPWGHQGKPGAADVTISPAMFCPGYPQGLMPLRAHGYFPRPSDLAWETPFGTDGAPHARMIEVSSPQGRTRPLMEASYLVEPVEGLWMLMIDANVFVPIDVAGDRTGTGPGDGSGDGMDDWTDSTSAGWNAMLIHKRVVLDWMADVAARARQRGKQLLAFSHYPALDPLDGTQAAEVALLGQTSTSGRIPVDAVGEAFIAAGIPVHFSGHLHVNDTARMRRGPGFFVNVAVPSLTGFPPAYKIATLRGTALNIETVSLDAMPMDAAIAGLYAAEIRRTGVETGGMAEATRYGDFLSAHIGHLAWRRHLKREWPAALGCLLRAATMADLEGLARCREVPLEDATALLPLAGLPDGPHAPSEADPARLSALAFLGDWYRVRMGSDLGIARVAPRRLALYDRLSSLYAATTWSASTAQADIAAMFALFQAYRGGLPSDHFTIDLVSGAITAGP